MHDSSPRPNTPEKRSRPRLFSGRNFAICVIVVMLSGLVFSELERYRQKQSEKLMFQFAGWVKSEILDKNPVSYRSTGGGQPGWFGDASAFVSTETPTGQPISIQIYVKSSPFQTKVAYIDLYASGMTGEQFRKLSTRQIGELMGKAHGRTIHLPVDAPQTSYRVDLRALIPEAFAASDSPK